MWSGVIILALLLAPAAPAEQTNNNAPAPKNTVPGLQLAPVPAILNAQMPSLPRGQGVVVEQIGAELPKSLATLHIHDVLLSYDGKPINNIEEFNRAVLAAKPEHKAPLVLLRGGKEMKVDVSLHVAESEVKGAVKPGGPPAVSMDCTVLDGGKMQITFQYYSESSGKLESLTCTGSLPEIEQQVRKHQLPSRVEDLVDVALKRLKLANQAK